MQSYNPEQKSVVTNDDLKVIRKMADQGETMEKIAMTVGMTLWRLRNSLRRDHSILIEDRVTLMKFQICDEAES